MASSVAVPGPAAAGSCNQQAAATSTDHGTRTVPFGHNKPLYSSLSLRELPKFDAMFQQRVSHRQLNHGSAVPSYGAPSKGSMKATSTPGTSFRSSTSTLAQQQHSTNTKSSYRPPPRSTSTTRLSSYGAHNSAGTSVVSGAAAEAAFTVGTPQIVHRLGDGGGGGGGTSMNKTTKITVGVPDLRTTLQKSMSERTLLLSTRANKLKPPTPLGIEKLLRVENWKLPRGSRLRPLRERVELEGGGEDNADEGAGASAFGTTAKPLYDSQEISKQLQQRRNRGENTQFAGAAALRGVVEGADATGSAAASTAEELEAPSRVVHVAVRRDAGAQSSSSPVALPVETSPPSTGSAMQSQAKNEQRSTAGKASSQSPEDHHDYHDAPGVVPPNGTPPLYADIRPVRVLVSAEDQHATSSAAAQHRGPTITTVESYNSKSSAQLRDQLQGASHSLEQQQQQNQNQNQNQGHLQRQQQSPVVQNRGDHEQATMINPARGSSKQPQGDHRPLQKISAKHPDALLAKTARLRKKVEMEMSKTREGQKFAEAEVGVSLKKVRYVEQQLRQARNELETSFGPMHLTSQRFKRQEQKVQKLAEDFKKAENKHREARGNQLELEEKFKILEKKLLHLRGIARNVFSGGAGAGPAGARAPAAVSSSLSAGAAAGGAAPVVAGAPSQPADGHSISMQPTPLEDGPEDSPLDPQVLTFQPTPVLNGGGLLSGGGRGAVALGSMNTVSSSFGRVGR